ncbi:hypothetical protein HUT18_18395 [Streptomyces sp. NA04227]|uniref:hypothetical protein n=1 Tax=Streptomyces sp. NA04227 TaxID=2742136 RepID=UPI00158FA176|nr:hypothetical protein [Streptomyces sp. NA04227]QKW08057.1 hypothetical protein HUT18_18395 [Streptomyces sp. NA04227]
MTDTHHPPDEVRAALRTLAADHVEAVRALLDGIADPVARERAARFYTDELLPDVVQGGAKSVRREAIRELRGQGLTLREVSGLTGLSVPRVDQLAKGK